MIGHPDGRIHDGDKRHARAGRKRGVPNRYTLSVKNMLEECAVKMGGVDAMVRWAARNPGDFYRLLVKLLPRKIELEGTLTLEDLVSAANRLEGKQPMRMIDVVGEGGKQDVAV